MYGGGTARYGASGASFVASPGKGSVRGGGNNRSPTSPRTRLERLHVRVVSCCVCVGEELKAKLWLAACPWSFADRVSSWCLVGLWIKQRPSLPWSPSQGEEVPRASIYNQDNGTPGPSGARAAVAYVPCGVMACAKRATWICELNLCVLILLSRVQGRKRGRRWSRPW